MPRKPSEQPDADAAGAPTPAALAPPPASFEVAIAELESLVQRMEGGALTLEESLSAYRRGAELVAFCRKALADVQQQVKVLEGELLEPFEAAGGSPKE